MSFRLHKKMTISCRLTGFFGCWSLTLNLFLMPNVHHLACNSHWSFHQNKRLCKFPFLNLVLHVSGLSFLFLSHFLCIPLCRLNHPPYPSSLVTASSLVRFLSRLERLPRASIAWNNLQRLELFSLLRQSCHLNIRPLSFLVSTYFLKPKQARCWTPAGYVDVTLLIIIRCFRIVPCTRTPGSPPKCLRPRMVIFTRTKNQLKIAIFTRIWRRGRQRPHFYPNFGPRHDQICSKAAVSL
ncbi:hypothetical protein C8R42DRAFT_61138 [Lentinula raphanica]|nr:hypothetical protein C8R42DRAFT_61138 [Lentinula raphanica]